MRVSAVLSTIVVSAVAVSAQTTPIQLINSLGLLLSSDCRNTLTSLVTNSTLAQCIQTPKLVPVLTNTNSSIIPQLDTYFKSICAAPACTNATIQNATDRVTTACSTDLSNFGISENVVEIVMDAYFTARKVVCLSTNSTSLVSSNSTMVSNTTLPSANSTNSTRPSTLCPISLLTKLQTYIGSPLSNSYIDSLLLGANATAYTQLLSVASNTTVIKSLACNDCVEGSLEIVLGDYPSLNTAKINLAGVNSYLMRSNVTANVTIPSNATYTIPQIYNGFCNATLGPNTTFPSSLNQTAFNTTLPVHNVTSTNITARAYYAAEAAKRRFIRWD